ncbi:hypothetical protein F2P56_004701 [Juglans regia]|uniref:Uncharacterized protein n=1 Tax=Juglans regia TaxID=51240 RepID=A0A833Y8N3_JUGRE|nr:hypothetical protein F2P56_004701 [Juglans regia]
MRKSERSIEGNSCTRRRRNSGTRQDSGQKLEFCYTATTNKFSQFRTNTIHGNNFPNSQIYHSKFTIYNPIIYHEPEQESKIFETTMSSAETQKLTVSQTKTQKN